MQPIQMQLSPNRKKISQISASPEPTQKLHYFKKKMSPGGYLLLKL